RATKLCCGAPLRSYVARRSAPAGSVRRRSKPGGYTTCASTWPGCWRPTSACFAPTGCGHSISAPPEPQGEGSCVVTRSSLPMRAEPALWRDRPTLVTGATGLVGSWVVRRLRELQADVVCLVRDWIPQCELVRSRQIEQVKVVRGDVRDQALLERMLGEHEVDTVLHLAAQTIV